MYGIKSRESMYFGLVARVGTDEVNGTRCTLVACGVMWDAGMKDNENLFGSKNM